MSTKIIGGTRLAGLAACAAATLCADFSYQESTRITGGVLAAMMRSVGSQTQKPTTSTVLIKGNRMARIRSDNAQIIDLDKETITNISFSKKTYSVMTFAQMKQMMQDVSQRTGQATPGEEPNFKASVRDTGKTKTIAGLNTTEKLVTLTMGGADGKAGDATTINTDMWLAPDISGYAEVRSFYKRMSEKNGAMGGSYGAMPGARGMSEGMAAMAKQMSKLNGVPVLQIISMSGGGTAGLGALGASKGGTEDSSVTLEMTTESSGFSSSPVDASKFEIPAGFQQAEPNAMRRGRK